METPTTELILSEIIKLNTKFDALDTKVNSLDVKFDVLDSKFTNLEVKMDKGFKEVNETISFIGNKFFDNHERRIATLENKI